MSDPIQRPIFNDGQILNAVDLEATVDYARDQQARHERYLHSWGIGYGFDLAKTPRTTAAGTSYVEVTVRAGLAVDGRGRQVVLASDQFLDPATFKSAQVYNPASRDPWYPVYVRGLLPQPVTQTSLTGACGGANLPTRETEGVQFIFRPPGPSSNSDSPYATPAPGDPTDPPTSVQPWDILIGFVQWDGTSQFTDAQTHNDAGITRRRAGVQAERVEAHDGSLTLQTSSAATKLMVVLQEKAGNTPGSLTFGGDDGQGGVKKLLHVDDQGNLSVQGKITSNTPLPPGSILVQSGIATDGVILPLPSGVQEDAVTAGHVLLHIEVVPILLDITQMTGVSPAPFAAFPLQCFVDQDRRVNCLVRAAAFASSATGPSIVTTDAAGTCRYTLIAAPPAAGGSSS
jgi:hypothetical protein